MIRPKAVVLADSAVVPVKSLVMPPPNRFTHVVRKTQPFYYSHAGKTAKPDGELVAGTQVVLMIHEGGDYCRVIDPQGLYVETAFAGLRRAPRTAASEH